MSQEVQINESQLNAEIARLLAQLNQSLPRQPLRKPLHRNWFSQHGHVTTSLCFGLPHDTRSWHLLLGTVHYNSSILNITMAFASILLVTVQWFCFGFSLSFSQTSRSLFIGDFTYAAFVGVSSEMLNVAPSVPALAWALYQLQFAVLTCALIFGAVADRLKLGPSVVFILIWTTCVYDVVTYWTWAENGWLRNLHCLQDTRRGEPCGYGALDSAGGGPVHVNSGFAALAFCLFMGRRRDNATGMEKKPLNPQSITNVFIGTALLWFGFYGFNGASTAASTSRAALSAFNTTLAACAAALTTVAIELSVKGRISADGTCCGVLAGLCGVTGGASFIQPWSALLVGIFSALSCSGFSKLMEWLDIVDDTLEVFAIHGIGGMCGCFWAGVFASSDLATVDGDSFHGGARDGLGIQVLYQLISIVSIAAYSFFATGAILVGLNRLGLRFRLTMEEERDGADLVELGLGTRPITPPQASRKFLTVADFLAPSAVGLNSPRLPSATNTPADPPARNGFGRRGEALFI
eukprot:g61855.t1